MDKIIGDFFSTAPVSEGPITVAVSGGGDSLALLNLVYQHLTKEGRAAELQVVTVNHRLRPEASKEVALVADYCENRGIKHSLLFWEGQKPHSGLMQSARYARYQLIFDHMKQTRSSLLLVGHTLDDQYETLYMRQQRGVGRGDSAMAPLSLLLGEIWLGRPLLTIRRQRLRDYLTAQGLIWAEDPTNENLAYERVRVRKLLEGKSCEDLQQRLVAAARVRQQISCETAQLLRGMPMVFEYGVLTLPLLWLRQNQRHPRLPWIMNLLVSLVGGRAYLLPSGQEKRLMERILVLEKGKKLTCARTLVERDAGMLYLSREIRHLSPLSIMPMQSAIWDERFLVRNLSDQTLTVRNLQLEELQAFEGNYSELPRFYQRALASHIGIFMPRQAPVLVRPPLSFHKDAFEVSYILRPYHFIVHGYDLPIYQALKDVILKK